MDFVKTVYDNDLAFLNLHRGKANALNSAMLDEIGAAFAAIRDDRRAAAVVLASESPAFFSAGFDVVEVFAYDRDAMHSFFGRFMDLYETMLRFPKPLVAAVEGHAYAGGAILALACDERVFAQGSYGFAVNEVHLGIVPPPGVLRMAAAAGGETAGRALALAGRTFSPQQALHSGVAAELAGKDARECAAQRALALAALPPQAYAAIKNLFADSMFAPFGNDRPFLETFLDHWFSPEAIECKNALVRSIKHS